MSSLFYRDTSGRFDNGNPLAADGEVNEGLKKRYTFTKNSNVVDMIGPHTQRHFLSGEAHAERGGR